MKQLFTKKMPRGVVLGIGFTMGFLSFYLFYNYSNSNDGYGNIIDDAPAAPPKRTQRSRLVLATAGELHSPNDGRFWGGQSILEFTKLRAADRLRMLPSLLNELENKPRGQALFELNALLSLEENSEAVRLAVEQLARTFTVNDLTNIGDNLLDLSHLTLALTIKNIGLDVLDALKVLIENQGEPKNLKHKTRIEEIEYLLVRSHPTLENALWVYEQGRQRQSTTQLGVIGEALARKDEGQAFAFAAQIEEPALKHTVVMGILERLASAKGDSLGQHLDIVAKDSDKRMLIGRWLRSRIKDLGMQGTIKYITRMPNSKFSDEIVRSFSEINRTESLRFDPEDVAIISAMSH
jgi:hypothetical protein